MVHKEKVGVLLTPCMGEAALAIFQDFGDMTEDLFGSRIHYMLIGVPLSKVAMGFFSPQSWPLVEQSHSTRVDTLTSTELTVIFLQQRSAEICKICQVLCNKEW